MKERRGELQVGLAAGGELRWAVADLSVLLEEARSRLDLSPVAAVALGRCLSGAALLQRLSTQTSSRLVIEIRGDGPLRSILAEANSRGDVRGMVGEPHVEAPGSVGDTLAVGPAIGKGLMRVVREQEGRYHQSQVELISGEIGKDLAHYLDQSEQRRSAILLGVLVKPAGVAAAGGLMVEVLPAAEDRTIGRLEDNIRHVGSPSRVIDRGGLELMLQRTLHRLEPEVVERRELRYRCRCRRETLFRHLVHLSPQDRGDLSGEDGALDVECGFCGTTYRFMRAEFEH
jgi:molecular chaperone Hsp33